MRVSLVTWDELDSSLLAYWRGWALSNPEYRSPFYSPVFTGLMARCREDVRIAILEQDNRVIGFWPQHRIGEKKAVSIGDTMCDYQGPITGGTLEGDLDCLLSACQIKSFAFNHLPVSSSASSAFSLFHPHIYIHHRSHIADLNGGWQAYEERLRNQGRYPKMTLANLKRTRRKLEQHLGPVRFDHRAGPEVLNALVNWKSRQYLRTGGKDEFSQLWRRETVEGVLRLAEPDCKGYLSALYAGDHLLAAHLGLGGDGVLHYWFPAYNPAYSHYFAGLLLLLDIFQSAPLLGIRCLDFGRGEDSYKLRFMTHSRPLGEGIITRPALPGYLQGMAMMGLNGLRQSPIGDWIRASRRDAARRFLKKGNVDSSMTSPGQFRNRR